MMRAEFNPPSDFTPDESGSGKKKIWMYLGLGCGGLLLIIGVLFALGAFRAVSCCSDLVDVGKRSAEAQARVQQMSLAIHHGEMERAYGFTSSSYQSSVSRQEFEEVFAPHLEIVRTGYPIVVDMQVKGESFDELRETASWVATVRFVPPRGQEILIADYHVVWTGEEGGRSIEVTSVQVERRVRPLQEEPPAQAVRAFLSTLRQGDWEAARRQLSAESPMRQGDLEEFRAFVRTHESVLTDRDIEIIGVEYGEEMTRVFALGDGRMIGFIVESYMGPWRISFVEVLGAPLPPAVVPSDEAEGEEDEEDEVDLEGTEE